MTDAAGVSDVHLEPRLLPMVESVSRSPSLGPTVAQWAAAAGMHERTLSQLFRTAFGTSFSRWRLHLMMNRAKDRLSAGVPVKTIAAEHGYGRTEAFSKSFRAVTGQWPSAWRERCADYHL